MTTDNQEYQEAKDKAEQKIGFYVHSIVFVLVNGMLVALDLTGSPGKTWFFWPLGGWGIGLALHALKVFGGDASGWKEKMIERELSRRHGRTTD